MAGNVTREERTYIVLTVVREHHDIAVKARSKAEARRKVLAGEYDPNESWPVGRDMFRIVSVSVDVDEQEA